MIEVDVPKEIKEYKAKLIAGLSGRRAIALGGAIVLGMGSYFLGTKVLNLDSNISTYLVALVSLPVLAVGFIEIKGFTFEKYLFLMFRYMMSQKKRPYQTSLPFANERSRAENENFTGTDKNKVRQKRRREAPERNEVSRKEQIRRAQKTIKAARRELKRQKKEAKS